VRLEQLDKRFTRLKRLDSRPIGIVDLDRSESKDIAKKWNRRVKRFQRDSNVSDSDAVGG